VLYDGDLTATTQGYTQAGWAHLRSLVDAGMDDLVFFPRGGAIPWHGTPAWLAPVRDAAGRGRTREPILVHTTCDQLAGLPAGDAPVHGMTAIDADALPRWTVPGLNLALRSLIVPSEHSRQAALRSGVSVPVRRVPHPVGEHVWADAGPSRSGAPYRFYWIGSWNARKNPEAAVRAFCRAFPEPGPGHARLALKLTGPDSLRLVVDDVCRQEARAAGQDPPGDARRPDIAVATGQLSEADVAAYHATCDCFVSGCRAEAWGIAAFHAACNGRPVVAPAWGAHPEYLSAARGDVLVGGALVPVSGMSGLLQYTGDQRWFDPDVDAMAAAMRMLADERRGEADPSALRREHGFGRLGAVLRDALGL